jgi:hypothetical protein
VILSCNFSGETEYKALNRDVRFGGHAARIKFLTVGNLWKIREGDTTWLFLGKYVVRKKDG